MRRLGWRMILGGIWWKDLVSCNIVVEWIWRRVIQLQQWVVCELNRGCHVQLIAFCHAKVRITLIYRLTERHLLLRQLDRCMLQLILVLFWKMILYLSIAYFNRRMIIHLILLMPSIHTHVWADHALPPAHHVYWCLSPLVLKITIIKIIVCSKMRVLTDIVDTEWIIWIDHFNTSSILVLLRLNNGWLLLKVVSLSLTRSI